MLEETSTTPLVESSTRPLVVRTTVSNARFKVEKFDGMSNFGMW